MINERGGLCLAINAVELRAGGVCAMQHSALSGRPDGGLRELPNDQCHVDRRLVVLAISTVCYALMQRVARSRRAAARNADRHARFQQFGNDGSRN
jgi:hypothetical protein